MTAAETSGDLEAANPAREWLERAVEQLRRICIWSWGIRRLCGDMAAWSRRRLRR